MPPREIVSRIRELAIVGVVRARATKEALAIARALQEGGIHAVEITITFSGALACLRELDAHRSEELLLGAGTVLDAATAEAAIDSGAQFVVGPGTDPAMIDVCHGFGKAAIPGALTPTEILHAHRLGADMVKVFPCGNVGGAAYIKALRAPLPDIALFPTGGVDLSTAPGLLRAGAAAVGAGTSLIDPSAVEAGDWAAITGRAREFVAAVRAARR